MMDTRTGEIKYFEENKKPPEHYIKILQEQMTKKQSEEMQVSKFDNRSELGKIFTDKRKERKKKAKGFRKRIRK